MIRCLMTCIAICLASQATGQQTSVVNTKHNLSAGGPGTVRASSESQVCIFCHAPHNASPIKPLWNRSTPADGYLIYSSQSFDALPGQPTGTSKMCLSCHDGTIALGNVASRTTPILMNSGVTTMPTGVPGHIGTDLRDDHPISFPFNSSLAAQDPNLQDPTTLPPEFNLDSNNEMQCMTCHDAHNNAFGSFLVMSNTGSQMCLSCHKPRPTTITGHQDCTGCHQTHSAPSGPYLLRGATVAATCTTCHDGSVPGAPDIASDLVKISVHDTHSVMDPSGNPWETVSCIDCHEPHSMHPGSGTVPNVHPLFGDIDGVNASGSPVQLASFEYEVCFKCHSDNTVVQPYISRQIPENNIRLEVDPGAISYHPIEAVGKNPDVPSLLPGWSTSSTMYCSDCHSSDTGVNAGGTGPDGVHGSDHPPLLKGEHQLGNGPESAQAYELCYSCHDRNIILSRNSFSKHVRHVSSVGTSCSTCHDPHGVSSSQGNSTNNSHLMNWDTSIVFPDPNTGRLEFVDTGIFKGECYLECHGRAHSPKTYR